jgi:hypothetical protein
MNFESWIPVIQKLYIYVIKGVRFRGYSSKPKGVREQKGLGNIHMKLVKTYMKMLTMLFSGVPDENNSYFAWISR